MRATILLYGLLLITKAHRAMVGRMVKGRIVVRELPLSCFLFLLPNYTNILVCFSIYTI